MSDAPLDAAALVGLLADDDRRRIVAALVLGASMADDAGQRAGLDGPRTWKALGRLVDAGLVSPGDDGTLTLLDQAFQDAARAAAAGRASADPAGDDVSPDVARVLRAFVRDGQLTSIPVARAKRLVVLDRLAQEFELGRHYPEAEVNVILARWHPDTASLRRYLVDEGFLDRAGGEYWRSGGSVETP
jgi:hypothetical protein